jgi:cytochrome c biogenesis protein CcmG, thiol:disulfide interchange protein DsbE
LTGPTSLEPRSGGRPPRLRWIGLLLAIALLTTGGVFLAARLGPPGGPTEIAKGQPAPLITGKTIEGQLFDLAALRGHPVVINFWASWCVPCQQEMPLLAEKAKSHADSGLQIVGVLSDDTIANGKAFESQYGATWPSVYDPTGSIKTAYRVLGRPQSYFVDATGILRSIQVGYLTDADFERQLGLITGG